MGAEESAESEDEDTRIFPVNKQGFQSAWEKMGNNMEEEAQARIAKRVPGYKGDVVMVPWNRDPETWWDKYRKDLTNLNELITTTDDEYFANFVKKRMSTLYDVACFIDTRNKNVEYVRSGFGADSTADPAVFSAVETLKIGEGVCLEFSNLFVALSRALGYSAWAVAGVSNSGGGHVWVSIKNTWIEPQCALECVSKQGVITKYKGLERYNPVFRYNGTDFVKCSHYSQYNVGKVKEWMAEEPKKLQNRIKH